ncbi:Asp23/Gls24 family envelope stress response protein, partial [Streptomyces sparsus]
EAERLPCGRSLDEVWEDGPAPADPHGEARPGTSDDPHYETCPHCRAALAELRMLDEYVRQEIAAEQRSTAEDSAGAASRITSRVMDIVRTELRPGPAVPLGTESDDAWIIETAAARTFRTAAQRVPGVQAGSCRVTPMHSPGRLSLRPGGRLPREPVRVRLEVSAVLDPERPVPGIADAVRERVRTAAEEELGMEVEAVDVVVIDLLDGPEDA